MLNKQKFSLLIAEITGLVYAICAIFVGFFPEFAADLMGWLTHVSPVERMVTLSGAIFGVIQTVIYSYVVAWLFAWIFNKSVSK